jgi:SWIM zinc finger
MEAREEKGLQIAATCKIEKNKLGYKVPSQSGNGSYIVSMDGNEPFCTCPDYEARHQPCKHIYAVEFMLKREEMPDGTTVVTKTMRVTYGQDWAHYNASQTHEQEHFVALLRDLCNGIPQPEYTFGRPRLPLADVVFGVTLKVYSTMSGRRFMPDLKVAEEKELVIKSPSFASGARYLENPELTPLLKILIEQSASPLKDIEIDFAVDSSGFSTTTYDRWFDHKWGKIRSEARWIKAHLRACLRRG